MAYIRRALGLLNSHFCGKAHCSQMMVQENVYKTAITTLSSKLYLQWTTFVSIKGSSVSQLPFLGSCHGHGREGLGRMEKCRWVLVFWQNPAGHPPRPRAGCTWAFSPFLWLFLPSTGRFPSWGSHWGVGLGWVISMGSGCIRHSSLLWEMLTASCNLIPQHLDHAAFRAHCTTAVLKKRGGENRKEPIPAFFKVSWKEQCPTQVTQFLERLQPLFLHVFRNTLQNAFLTDCKKPCTVLKCQLSSPLRDCQNAFVFFISALQFFPGAPHWIIREVFFLLVSSQWLWVCSG